MAKKGRLNDLLSKMVTFRMWVQSAFLLVWLDPLAVRMHGICAPVFHCYSCPLATFACPIGVLANFSALHLFPFIAVGTILVVGALLGSLICGWVCPFGLLQDAVAKLPTPKVSLPRWTGHFRYIVLITAVLVVPYFYGEGHTLFFLQALPCRGLGRSFAKCSRGGNCGQTIRLAKRYQIDHHDIDSGQYVFLSQAVVQDFLSAWSDIRTFQPVFRCFSKARQRKMRPLQTMPRAV